MVIWLQTDYQKVVRNRSHSSIGENDPNNDQVAASRHDDHDGEEHRPEDNPPPRQAELVIWRRVFQEAVVLSPIKAAVIEVHHHIRVADRQVPVIPQERHRAPIPKSSRNSKNKQARLSETYSTLSSIKQQYYIKFNVA